MKAIILCAGMGGRLRPLTENRPKCLLTFSGRTILECGLENFAAAGIDDVVLVTGYRRDLVETLAREKAGGRVSFVYNGRYAETNTAASLNLALKVMDDDFILANGDVLFDASILNDLVRSPAAHVIAVDAAIKLDWEEVKVVAPDSRVEKIGKELDPRECLGEAIGLNKVGRGLIPDLRTIYDELERKGETRHFFEVAFDRICRAESGQGRDFRVVLTRGRPWAEIDTLEDFEYARREIYPRLRG
jgi:choline kinase